MPDVDGAAGRDLDDRRIRARCIAGTVVGVVALVGIVLVLVLAHPQANPTYRGMFWVWVGLAGFLVVVGIGALIIALTACRAARSSHPPAALPEGPSPAVATPLSVTPATPTWAGGNPPVATVDQAVGFGWTRAADLVAPPDNPQAGGSGITS